MILRLLQLFIVTVIFVSTGVPALPNKPPLSLQDIPILIVKKDGSGQLYSTGKAAQFAMLAVNSVAQSQAQPSLLPVPQSLAPPVALQSAQISTGEVSIVGEQSIEVVSASPALSGQSATAPTSISPGGSAVVPGQTGTNPIGVQPGQTNPSGTNSNLAVPGTNPGGIGVQPGQTGTNPAGGQPGQLGNNPSGNAIVPGSTGTNPIGVQPDQTNPAGTNRGGTAGLPGQTRTIPTGVQPGQTGTNPSGVQPGQTGTNPSGVAPGQIVPGQTGTVPPGQTGNSQVAPTVTAQPGPNIPGQGLTVPGQIGLKPNPAGTGITGINTSMMGMIQPDATIRPSIPTLLPSAQTVGMPGFSIAQKQGVIMDSGNPVPFQTQQFSWNGKPISGPNPQTIFQTQKISGPAGTGLQQLSTGADPQLSAVDSVATKQGESEVIARQPKEERQADFACYLLGRLQQQEQRKKMKS